MLPNHKEVWNMVILSSSKILELRDLYNKTSAYKSLNVLKQLELIASQSGNNSIPLSFNIPYSYYDCDIISEVLHDLGIPYIYIRSVFKVSEGYHVQLHESCK